MTTSLSKPDVFYTVCPVPSAISIAIGRGDLQRTFQSAGVTLHNIRHSPERAVREAHYDQTQANLFREGGNIPPLWARSDGRNLRLIGLTWIEHYAAVLALPGSNIRGPQDLKGKRLGIVSRPNDTIDYARATTLRGYVTALKAAGLTLADVELVDIAITEPLVAARPSADVLSSSAFSASRMRAWDGLFVKALFEGSVDAIYVTSKGRELQQLLGANVVFNTSQAADPFDRINNLALIAFTVRGELLESNPDIVTSYVAQDVRTARWAAANAHKAARYIARDTGAVEEDVGAQFSPDVASALEPSLDDRLLAFLDNQKNFLLEHGFIKNDFKIEDFVAREPLRQAKLLVDQEQSRSAA